MQYWLPMIGGILNLIGACFFWGLLVVIPQTLSEFSPFEISLGRYLCFGFFSLISLSRNWRLLKKYSIKVWLESAFYTLLSTFVGFTCFVFCIRFANPSLAALLFGMSPLTVAFVGNWIHREYPWRLFAFPTLIMSLGILLIHFDELRTGAFIRGSFGLGFLLGLVGLFSWTWYMLGNLQFLRRNPKISPSESVTMMGLAALLLSLVAILILPFVGIEIGVIGALEKGSSKFWIGALIAGGACTFAPYYLWNRGMARLPITLSGQLMIFELLFALSFVYLYNREGPTPLEGIGIGLIFFGIWNAVRQLKPVHA